jgi:hypothetical protein
MAALRKILVVLAVAAVALAGASGTANAQTFHPVIGISCFAFAVPAQARAEGIAELLGDVIADCQPSTPDTNPGLPPSILANVTVTLNVNITNNIDFGSGSSVIDGVLLVNEVGAGTINPTTTSTLAGVVPNTPGPQYGVRVAPGSAQWSGVIFPVPNACLDAGCGTTNFLITRIRVTNLRGNVSQLGIPSGDGIFPSAQVTAFLSISSTTAIPVTNNVLNIGVPLLGLLTRYRGPQQADPADVRFPTPLLQCLTLNLDRDNDIIVPESSEGSGDEFSTFTVRLSEGFASAFKTLGTTTITPAAAIFERGYPTPNSNCLSDGICGGATQGTRFILRLYNVPAGVRAATPTLITGTSVGGHTLTIFRIAGTDANGAGAFNNLSPSTEITISGGFGFAVFEVVDTNPFAVENVVIPVYLAYRPNTANDLPGVGTIQASVNFAPLSTVTTANKDAPEPRFVDSAARANVATISRCITNLLWPFVTNQAGFDTGFSIANTSSDDKGSEQQSGNCTLFYFGSTTGGGAAPANQTTATIPAGTTVVWTLSGGNAAANIAGTPGFQGYLFARCQFLFAHGFAFISNGFGGVPTIAEGYLALVVPWDGVAGSRIGGAISGGRAGETLGH